MIPLLIIAYVKEIGAFEKRGNIRSFQKRSPGKEIKIMSNQNNKNCPGGKNSQNNSKNSQNGKKNSENSNSQDQQ